MELKGMKAMDLLIIFLKTYFISRTGVLVASDGKCGHRDLQTWNGG